MSAATAEDTRKAAALDLLPLGVVLTDPSLRLLEANAAARTILQRADGLVCAQDRLACRLPGDQSQLAQAIVSVQGGARASARTVVRISRRDCNRPYVALVISAPDNDCCLLLIADPAKAQETEAFGGMFDLSEHELGMAARLLVSHTSC